MQVDLPANVARRIALRGTHSYHHAGNAALMLLAIFLLNVALGFPAAASLAYLAPISYATQRGGLRNGLPILILSTSVVTLSLAMGGLMNKGGLLLNVVIEASLLTGCMLLTQKGRQEMRKTVEKSNMDDLTGARSRNSITEAGQQAVNRAIAAGQPLAVAMIDLDKFKLLNDTYGHAHGDKVLKELVSCLRRALGPGVLIGRTGGDEFLAILPNRKLDEAERMLETACNNYSDRTLVSGHASSFSYGIGTPGRDGFSWDTLLDAADQDMYRRKSANAVRRQVREAFSA
jgi:diguanylate cyclase (GGDEF)-like protein